MGAKIDLWAELYERGGGRRCKGYRGSSAGAVVDHGSARVSADDTTARHKEHKHRTRRPGKRRRTDGALSFVFAGESGEKGAGEAAGGGGAGLRRRIGTDTLRHVLQGHGGAKGAVAATGGLLQQRKRVDRAGPVWGEGGSPPTSGRRRPLLPEAAQRKGRSV